MKKVTKVYKVYSFDELDEKGKKKALNDEIEFYLQTAQWDDDGNPLDIAAEAAKEAERMQTPWFTGAILYQNHEKEIRESCIEHGNKYLASGKYFAD